MARLIDTIGDEMCAGTTENYRTVLIRRLWTASVTGTVDLGKSNQQLKPNEWIRLAQWFVNHMDKVAVEQWTVQGQSQLHAEQAEDKVAAARAEIEAKSAAAAEKVLVDEDEQVNEMDAARARLLAILARRAETDPVKDAVEMIAEDGLPDDGEQVSVSEGQVEPVMTDVAVEQGDGQSEMIAEQVSDGEGQVEPVAASVAVEQGDGQSETIAEQVSNGEGQVEPVAASVAVEQGDSQGGVIAEDGRGDDDEQVSEVDARYARWGIRM